MDDATTLSTADIQQEDASRMIRFTIFEATGSRLSKLYTLATDGSVRTKSGTQFATGSYRVADFDASDHAGALVEIGRMLDGLSSNQAIGLGVPRDGATEGRITTKARYDDAGDAIPRTLEHFGWPDGPGLLLLDGDGIDELQAILSELYPPFADVALLRRTSASASVINPKTGKALKTGEHCYCVIDDPTIAKACLEALMRLAWCRGSGKAAGRLLLSKSGAVLVRGPVDACVGSPERLSYEGAAVIGNGLTTLPRVSQVIGGKGVLCANDLLEFAEQNAPAGLFVDRVNDARNEPEFCDRRAEVQATYRAEHINAAVTRGVPREKAEAAYDEALAAGTSTSGNWTFVPLTPEHVLYGSDGSSFSVADIQKDPAAFHKRECCDPVEGTSYQSRNCAIIYTNGARLEIYSRAHGDAFAYVAPLDRAFVPWAELFAQIGETRASDAAASAPAAGEGAGPQGTAAVEPVDLWAKFDPPLLPCGLLPPLLEAFAFDRSAVMGCDPAGLAVGALVVCAASIPEEVRIQPKRNDTRWLESARIWGGLIGGVSEMKSPMLCEVVAPVGKIDNEMSREYHSALAAWLRLPKKQRSETPKPKQLRARMMNTTVEAAQEILKDSPNGVLLDQDELSGWFGSMDKYSGARGAQADRAFWLQSYNGGPYSVDRIIRGSTYIPHLSVSILGFIQPEPIRKLADGGEDDGLLQRFITIVLRPAMLGGDEAPGQSTFDYDSLIKKLRELRPPTGILHVPTVLRFDDGALKIRLDLEKKHLELSHCSTLNRKLTSHIGKYNGIFARLCVIWHCVEHAGRAELPAVVTDDTARRVADFLHDFLFPHAMAFYANVLGLSNDHDRLANVADYILAHALKKITTRDVARGDRSMRGLKKHETDAIFEQLEALGWVTRSPGPRPSDPPRWMVNPVVHLRFAERAEAEKERRERDRRIVEEQRKKGKT